MALQSVRSGASRPFVSGFLNWIPLAVATTLLSGLVYVAVQQNFRTNANDPQIQMAQDAAARIGSGDRPQDVVGSGKVDMSRSLAPYLIIYDASGKAVASSAELDGQTPDLPPGVLDSVRQSGEDRISWQPRPGVRSAAVVEPVGGGTGGFVLAGRSLLEVEKRESQLTGEVGVAWLAALVGSLGAALAVAWLAERLAAARQI